jgi:DNA-binding transcriptional LysR family regulator
MPLKIRELEVFRAIMEVGSITGAARLLHVTQPAISKMLQQTEDRLGFQCFVRDQGRLTPTAEGRALLPEVMKAVSAIEWVQRFAEDLKAARSGLLSIAAVPSLSTSILPPAIRRFRAGRPNVGVALKSLTNHEVIRLVAEHRVDVGLVLLPADDAQTLSRHMCASDLTCVLPQGHPLATLEKIGPRELSRYPLVSFGRDRPMGVLIEQAFERLKLRHVIAVEVTQSAAALALIRAGAGIAVMDGFALMDHPEPDLVVRPFSPTIRVTCRLLWSRHHPMTRLTSTFVDVLDDEIKSLTNTGHLHRVKAG